MTKILFTVDGVAPWDAIREADIVLDFDPDEGHLRLVKSAERGDDIRIEQALSPTSMKVIHGGEV